MWRACRINTRSLSEARTAFGPGGFNAPPFKGDLGRPISDREKSIVIYYFKGEENDGFISFEKLS